MDNTDDILEPIRVAIWEAKRDYKNVLKIHVTCDFYLRIKAECPPQAWNIQKPFENTLWGYLIVEHFEPCEKEFWLEIEGESTSHHVVDFDIFTQ